MDATPPFPPPVPPAPRPPGTQAPVPAIATVALVLGVFSITCLGCFAGVPAIVCGHIAQSRINQSSGALGGGGVALAGLIMGYASLALTLVLVPILAALAVPAFAAARDKSQGVRVQNDFRALATAIEAYRVEYGRWPTYEDERDSEAENARVLNALRAIDLQANPRQITFYEAAETAFKGSDLNDPWGRPYHFAFDQNRDNAVAIHSLRAQTPVAIWSDGPNGLNEYGEGDDITSWKPLPTRPSR